MLLGSFSELAKLIPAPIAATDCEAATVLASMVTSSSSGSSTTGSSIIASQRFDVPDISNPSSHTSHSLTSCSIHVSQFAKSHTHIVQSVWHPSQSTLFPSSHSSPIPTLPSPHLPHSLRPVPESSWQVYPLATSMVQSDKQPSVSSVFPSSHSSTLGV